MEYNDQGEFRDIREETYLRPVVKEFQKLHAAYKIISGRKKIVVEKLWAGDLKTEWHNPLNTLFDFSRFREETRWIDDKMYASLGHNK